jgi:hypothetical protein
MIDSVPQYPIDTQRKNAAQRSFYERWLKIWYQGNALDINGEYGYLFDFMHELIRSTRKKQDTRVIVDELTRLREAYPYKGWKSSGSFHLYSLEYIADAHIVLKEYHEAIDSLSQGYRLVIPADVNKLLSLKLLIGGEVSGYDLLFLWRTPTLTAWGRKNIGFVAECAEDLLSKYRVYHDTTILTSWASKVGDALGKWDPPWKTVPLFYGVARRFKTKIPYYYFNYLHPFSKDVTDLVREAENLARNRSGIPRIGEGWVAETELYCKIKEQFLDYDVEHHASPSWLGRQHLDIYIPKMRVAVEYQGKQHDEPVEFFGGEEAYLRTRQRDAKKLALCKENGVVLLYVRAGYELADVVAQIELAAVQQIT